MAYNELIKNFNKIRSYMRDFYVYGFKTRKDYQEGRTYDDERRRVESWLKDYMQFRNTSDGKIVFLSIDSREVRHNPLFKGWKAKSFTDGDITLHFLLMDILSDEQEVAFPDLVEEVGDKLSAIDNARFFDESTIRKKLKEYVEEGIVSNRKIGKTQYYRKTDSFEEVNYDALHFFSEVAPCGVIGSYLLDRQEEQEDHLAFKHHYITNALDSEILNDLLTCIQDRQECELKVVKKDNVSEFIIQVVPLQILISAQSGRQYVVAYDEGYQEISTYRIDRIIKVKQGKENKNFDIYRDEYRQIKRHMWGVVTPNKFRNETEHVEFTIEYSDDEKYIPKRLEREKRCGTVEHLDQNHSRFSADVYDAQEMVTWIRTFICRICDLSISNQQIQSQFLEDLNTMYQMYEIEEETHVIQ